MPRGQKQQKIIKHMKKPDDMDNPSPSTQIKRPEETQHLEQLLKELKMNNETIVRDMKEIKKTLEEHKEDIARLNKKMDDLMEIKETVDQIKKILDTHSTRLEEVEQRISDLEDDRMENESIKERMGKKIEKLEMDLRDMIDNMKRPNIRLIGVPEGEEKGKGLGRVFKEIVGENFPNLLNNINTQIINAQRTPNRINPKKPTPRHILITLSNIEEKEQVLKAAREKQFTTYKGNSIRLSSDYSAATMEARRQWHDIFKILSEKNFQPRILYPAKLSFKFEGELKFFTDKQMLREFANKRPALLEILKGALQTEKQRQDRETWRKVQY